MARADKWTVARILDEIAQYIELSDPNRFRARAFERAARAVENLEDDIGGVIAAGRLYETQGIGKAIGPIIEEIVETSQSRYLDDLRKQYPPGIFDLLRVPKLGLKKIGLLYESLGIASLDELEAAARAGKLTKLKGFGPKTESQILGGIEWARRRTSQFLLPTGLEIGERIRERLAAIGEIEDAEVVGSVRRRLEVVRNVNFAIATRDSEAVRIALSKLVDKFELVDETTFRGFARNEIDVMFHLSPPDRFGANVLRTTGSALFTAALEEKAGRPLDALEGPSEREIFERIEIPYVEPERRDTAEELARRRRPRLVETSDLRGTFHVHTTYSDGRNTVLQMLQSARERGFDYVGISDHSKTAYYAGGLSEERLEEQQAEIARVEPEVAPLRVFRGTEADILVDGSIDYGPKTLDRFDFVVASVHSRFNMPEDEMTERILKALDDPHVTFLGHLTGRLLLARDGYAVDYDRIFEKAAEREVMIEINGNPRRLDVDWRHLPRALELGCMFAINTDAHSIAEMSHIISGTWAARKAGLTPRSIFNARPVEEVAEFLGKRRQAAAARKKATASR
jgi:DNA polymerase (family 10)